MPKLKEWRLWFRGEEVDGFPELPKTPEDKKREAEEAARLARQEARAGKREEKAAADAIRGERRKKLREKRAAGRGKFDKMTAARDRSKVEYNEDFSDAKILFGKYKGMWMSEIADENPTYLEWIIEEDFPDTIKEVAASVLEDYGIVI